MNNMGKVLVKGTGNGGNAILGWAAFYVAGAIVSFVLAYTVGIIEVPVGWGQTESYRTNAVESIHNDVCTNEKMELFIECRGCNNKYDAEHNICPYCGYLSNTEADVRWECNKCSTINLETNSFCKKCNYKRV
ncbi:MAG: hypothetical protein FWC32_06940 [Firmicutes bacterium]|nr:hypothetical protein [Bacillota bacterium]